MTHATAIDLRDLVDSPIDAREGDEHIDPAAIADSDGPDPQGEMFPAESFRGLQRRYPAARSDGRESSYVLRDALSGADVEFNLARLRREAGAKSAHADVLE
jgi:hypothetical protein